MRRIPAIATALALMFIFSGCGMTKALFHRKKAPKPVVVNPDNKTLWHFRYQYVRIEPQDACPNLSVAPNSQPAQISPDKLHAALAALRIIAPNSEAPVPLFNSTELNLIVGPIAAGLSRCSAQEDITFAVLGAHKGKYGYQNVVTAGRLFLINNRLNLILGSIHTAIADYSRYNDEPTDYRQVTFSQGSRCKISDSSFRILASPPAIELHDQGGVPRRDWVMMDMSMISEMKSPSYPEPPPGVSTVHGEAPNAKPAAASLPAAGQPMPPQRMKAAPAMSSEQVITRTLEERLMILKRLHDNNLITDKEYKEKKKDILNEL